MPRSLFLVFALSVPLPLLAQLPLRDAPVCLRLTYDSVPSGMGLADLPTELRLDRGDRKGNVRALDSSLAQVRLDRGQEWTIFQRDSSFSYFVTMAGAKDVMLGYSLTLRATTLSGSLAAIYIDRANGRAQQLHAHVQATIESCPR